MLKSNEFSHNHHPSRVKMLAKYIRREISVIVNWRKMKKKTLLISILVLTLMFMLACSVALEGISIGDEQETLDPWQELKANQTFDAMLTQDGSAAAETTSEPEYQPVDSQGSSNVDPQTANAGSHEYSVEATNFDCTCQASGNITPIINFTGTQVEFPNADGTSLVYDKIGDNTYKRTWMGYYILQNGSGAQATETKVEEEQHTVLIFSSTGYRMESYQGSSETPCCYYTNTIVK